MMSNQSVAQNIADAQQTAFWLLTATGGGALDHWTVASVPAVAKARGRGHLLCME